jgi:hypothetical protein
LFDDGKKYTNHSVRKTVVTLLQEKGIEDRRIAMKTGHRSLKSLDAYAADDGIVSRQVDEALHSNTAVRLEPSNPRGLLPLYGLL